MRHHGPEQPHPHDDDDDDDVAEEEAELPPLQVAQASAPVSAHEAALSEGVWKKEAVVAVMKHSAASSERVTA